MTSVYIHTCPNGKKYVGIADNPEQRWANGNGYRDNEAFFTDIEKFGWNVIKHEIIKECDTREEALHFEALYIALLDTENPQNGYNRTNIIETCMRDISNAKEIKTQNAVAKTTDYESIGFNFFHDFCALAKTADFMKLVELLKYIESYSDEKSIAFDPLYGKRNVVPICGERLRVFREYEKARLCGFAVLPPMIIYGDKENEVGVVNFSERENARHILNGLDIGVGLLIETDNATEKEC